MIQSSSGGSAHSRSHLNGSGNWCGHKPSDPRFFEPDPHHGKRPDVIQRAIANLMHFYRSPSHWLKSLRLIRHSPRQYRSEARERDAGVLGVLLHYTDLASLRVGIPKANGEFISLDMKFIARKLKWRNEQDDQIDRERVHNGKAPLNRGLKRVWRCINHLKRAGYLTVKQQCEKFWEGEVQYAGLPAIRTIRPKLFWELGINNIKFDKQRKQAIERLKKKYYQYLEKLDRKLKRGANITLETILDLTQHLSGKKTTKRKYPKYRRWERELDNANEKRRLERCYELKLQPQNQGLSAADFYAKYPELQRHQWHKKE